MQFDRGYMSAYFITDSEHMESVISEPYILIYDKKISAAQDIVPVLEKLVQIGKRDLVIIAEDIRRRSPRYARLEQTARHVERSGRQSPRLW